MSEGTFCRVEVHISYDLKKYYHLVHYECCCLFVCLFVSIFFNGKMKSITMVTKSLQFKYYVKLSN